MNQQKRLWLLGFVTTTLSLAACQTVSPVSEVAVRDGSFHGLDSVVFVDKNLQSTIISKLGTFSFRSQRQSKITLIDLGADRSSTGFLEAWALLQNLSSHDLMLEWRASFFDVKRKPIQPLAAWQLASAPRNSKFSIEGMAASTEAHHYVIELRQA